MKQFMMLIAAMLVLMLNFPLTVSAEASGLEELNSRVDQQLRENIDNETRTELVDLGMDNIDVQSVVSVDERSIFKKLWDSFTRELRSRISALGRILAVTVICSCFRGMFPETDNMSRVMRTVSLLTLITVLSSTLTGSYEALKASVDSMNSFMISYIPVYSAVTTAGGYPTAAGAYGASTLLICEGAAAVSSGVLIPFLNASTALTVVASLDPALKASDISTSLKNAVTRLLTVMLIIFLGLMSLKGAAAASADDLTAKSFRFAASSFIPFVGGYASDAFLTVKSGMKVIRTTTGIIGTAVIMIMALKPFFSLLSIKLLVWIGALFNDLTGSNENAALLRGINNILSIALGILIAFVTAFVVSTASVLTVSLGG